jgi:hypothetical protein
MQPAEIALQIDDEMHSLQEEIEQLGHKVLFHQEKIVRGIASIKD